MTYLYCLTFQEFDSVLNLKNAESSDIPQAAVKLQENRCFNCLGDHSVANCPKPRDQQEIFKNRKIFLNNQPKQMMYKYFNLK